MTYLFMLLQWLAISPGNIYLNPNRDFVRQVEMGLTDEQWNYVFNLDA